jgi:hypothetical protein
MLGSGWTGFLTVIASSSPTRRSAMPIPMSEVFNMGEGFGFQDLEPDRHDH